MYNAFMYLDLTNVFRHGDKEYITKVLEHSVSRRGYVFQQK